MAIGRYLRGAGVVAGLALAIAPFAAVAQGGAVYVLIDTTNKEVRDAIQRHLAEPGGKLPPVGVTNIQIERGFATANVVGKKFPLFFLKKAVPDGHKWEDGHFWKVIFSGRELGSSDCKAMGFSKTSKLCSY